MRWKWIGLLWLLVLFTGNLLHPLAHESNGISHDCLVCTLQSLPALTDDSGEAVRHALEPAWEPVRLPLTEPPLKLASLYLSHLTPRAPPF